MKTRQKIGWLGLAGLAAFMMHSCITAPLPSDHAPPARTPVVSSPPAVSPEAEARWFIKQRLKSPSAATFRLVQSTPTHVVYEVTAPNAFNAPLTKIFLVTMVNGMPVAMTEHWPGEVRR